MSFLTADILLCHLVGDYILQSDWMAQTKTKSSIPALAHALTYTLPFLFLTTSWKALLIIAATHFLIDRFRLARYVCWGKNFFAPRWLHPTKYTIVVDETRGTQSLQIRTGLIRNLPWNECSDTGYPKDLPVWLSVWLLIITDNTLHLICNAIALRWFS